MPDDVRCPACGRPAGSRATCAECGWPLQTRPQAGALTAAIRKEFDQRLGQAQAEQAERDERTLRAALGDVVTAARLGQESLVIAVGSDGIQASAVAIDRAGTPQVRDDGVLPWGVALPWLPPDTAGRHAGLTGAAGQVDGGHIARLVRDRLPSGGGKVLVVAWPAGWRTLEAVAESVARAAGAAARLLRVMASGGVPVRDLLAEAAAAAPLRRPYYLMTASVDGFTGSVRVLPRKLFDVGAVPGTVHALTWRRLPGDMGDTTAAVFTDEPPAPPVAMYQVPVPAGADCTLRIVLDGPGRVRVAEPPGAVRHPDTWDQVNRTIPQKVVTVTAPVDLVCAVDLAGDFDTVRRRKTLARKLIELLAGEYPGPRRLQVAVVTCTDHIHRRGLQDDPVTQTSDMDSAASALQWLATAEGAGRSGKFCTPVEDMLRDAAGLLADSARRGRRARLVTLAGRPPHPHRHVPGLPDVIPCPRRLDWHEIVAELRSLQVTHAVVVDALPSPKDKRRADWNELGPAGQLSLPAARARDVAACLGLLADAGQCVPLPLTDDREGVLA